MPAEPTAGLNDAPGDRIWCEMAGAGSEIVLILHGGPSAPSNYPLDPMTLAGDDHRVDRGNKIGLARSDWPHDDALWQLPRCADEGEVVSPGYARTLHPRIAGADVVIVRYGSPGAPLEGPERFFPAPLAFVQRVWPHRVFSLHHA